jgi:phosphoglycerate dehydrogenase-like enzyme
MAAQKRFKVVITDPLLKEMVNQTNTRFPEAASKIDFVVMDKVDEQELIEKVPGADILAVARSRINKNVLDKADKLFFI